MDPIIMNEDKVTNNNICKKKIRPFEDPVTREDVEIVVKRAFRCTMKIINYHVRAFSEEKLGFLGAHRHLVVTVQREASEQREIHTFFLKSVPYEIEEQATLVMESKAFYKETNFYKRIMPELLRGLKDKSWLGLCYLVKEDALIFEDLKSRNFVVKSQHLDAAAVNSALTVLARLHGSSILAEKRLGRSFQELYPDLLEECVFKRNGKFHDWYSTGVKVIVAVARQLGLDPKGVPEICDRIFEMIGPSRKWRNVVCHGDAKSYNWLFDDSRPSPKCILVDFQLVRYAPATADVLQLLYLTTRRQFRERNEEELLRHYHEALCETLRDNDKEIALPSLDEILQEYEEMRLVGLVTTALYSPINLIETKMYAEMTKDSDGFAKLLFGDTVKFTLDMMQRSLFYKDVMTEIVKEMVQRSRQLLAL